MINLNIGYSSFDGYISCMLNEKKLTKNLLDKIGQAVPGLLD